MFHLALISDRHGFKAFVRMPTHTAFLIAGRSSGMHWVGNGFPVRSVFDYNGLGRELSPFLLLDYAAPYEFRPAMRNAVWVGIPHKALKTVTVAYKARWNIATPVAAAERLLREMCNG